jgi:hypothetical protein
MTAKYDVKARMPRKVNPSRLGLLPSVHVEKENWKVDVTNQCRSGVALGILFLFVI